ncbi:HNH endonuclease [Nocardia sp. NPDC051570]|uniref:HNH endonuclease n=1 Tax=Nocardia sp. NPDC051570 TaxID=3364324 RepID=UPI0037B63C93
MRRDRGLCQLRLAGCRGSASEVDHRVAVAFGGSDRIENLHAVCAPCHKLKTRDEALQGIRRRRAAAIHPDHKRKHPGLL